MNKPTLRDRLPVRPGYYRWDEKGVLVEFIPRDKDYSILPMESIDDLPQEEPIPKEHYTCHYCTDNDKCEWAWDRYNTDGDCLAIK